MADDSVQELGKYYCEHEQLLVSQSFALNRIVVESFTFSARCGFCHKQVSGSLKPSFNRATSCCGRFNQNVNGTTQFVAVV